MITHLQASLRATRLEAFRFSCGGFDFGLAALCALRWWHNVVR